MVGCDLQEDVGGALDVAVTAVGLEVRAAADEIGAGVERVDQQAALRRPRPDPVIGHDESATISTSITSATRRLTSTSASMLSSPCS